MFLVSALFGSEVPVMSRLPEDPYDVLMCLFVLYPCATSHGYIIQIVKAAKAGLWVYSHCITLPPPVLERKRSRRCTSIVGAVFTSWPLNLCVSEANKHRSSTS